MRAQIFSHARPHIRRHIRRLHERRRGGPGKNLAPAPASWTVTLNGGAAGTVTVDANGLHFSGANNSATAQATGLGIVDNGVYLLKYTISGLTLGSVKAQLYGATVGHIATGATRSANGNYQEILTIGAGGTLTNLLRFLANGTSPNNTYTITNIELRRIS